MKKMPLKTLALSIALALPLLNAPVFADSNKSDKKDDPMETPVPITTSVMDDMATPSTTADKDSLLNKVLGKPGAREGLIKTNKQIYYAGDSISIQIKLPSSLKPFLEETAQLQLLLYIPTGAVVASPVIADGKFFEGTIDTTALPAGVYQLGLVLVKPNGDATKIADWYGGFGALLSSTRLKISEKTSSDAEDSNSDGLVEGDTNGDGYIDSLVGDNDTSAVQHLVDKKGSNRK